ncbi:MAG: pyridoxine 5'-phosphate synthase, partial [candidate division Zixibacteria bacterium]|nr:pyridoxine 5'-phosphate synthase [candidate division Zixibacteria bacterium]
MSSLTVNVDTVAALRALRGYAEPDPVQAAVLAELAGADGVAIQLLHKHQVVRDRDLYLLKGVVKTRLTFEMPPLEDFINKALEVKPWMVTFASDQLGGDKAVLPVDLSSTEVDFRGLTDRLTAVGVLVGFFIEPEVEQVKQAARNGGSSVLINCSGYANARILDDAQRELDRIDSAGTAAVKAGLAVNCGRGLTY